MVFEQGNALLGVTALIRAAGGEVEGRVRIQKEAFLLGLKGLLHFKPGQFSYHFYGPYSRELSDALNNAVAFGLVREDRQDFKEDHSRYTYSLTPEGGEWLSGRENTDSESFQREIEFLQGQKWRTLELAATVAYLETRGHAPDRRAAFRKAISMKPECEKFAGDAETVLNSLDL